MASTAAPPSRGALRVAVGSVVLVSFGLEAWCSCSHGAKLSQLGFNFLDRGEIS